MNGQNFFIRTKINNQKPKNETKPKLDSTVEFNLPDNSKVNLFLSDKNGNVLFTIVKDKFLRKGYYSKKFDFTKLPVGLYYYKLKTDLYEFTKALKLM